MDNFKTVEDVKAYALKHYEDGYDWIIECQTDEDIQEHITSGDIAEWMHGNASVMNEYREAARYFSGEPEGGWANDDDSVETTDYYCPSAAAHDYSPSNPWDAPGMSIRDFI